MSISIITGNSFFIIIGLLSESTLSNASCFKSLCLGYKKKTIIQL